MNDSAVRTLLRTSLQAAVPLWIERLRRQPWAEVEARARESAQVVANKGDIILYKSTKPGETAKAFNALAEGVAALAFCPGGVTFLEDHWVAEHPDTVVSSLADVAGAAPNPKPK